MEMGNIAFQPPRIKVVGIGGGGSNVVNRMIRDGIDGVDYCVINTDVAVLRESPSPTKIAIGRKLTKGQGAGMIPDVGKRAAVEDIKDIEDYLRNGDLVFIAVGLGGGTGTGAAPVVAEISKELGILTVGVATLPFSFEGKKRMTIARSGLEELKKHTDTLMTIPNDRLLEIAESDNQNLSVMESFDLADDVLKQAINGLTVLINRQGVINLDFADVKTVMTNKGKAIIGIGHGVGDGRGLTAVKRAIQSPILNDVSIKGATGVIVNFLADQQFGLQDAQRAVSYIESNATEDAHVMFGLVHDPTKSNEVSVTVIATGFEDLSFSTKKLEKQDILGVWESEEANRNSVSSPKILHLNNEEKKTINVTKELKLEPINTVPLNEDFVELELKKIHLTHVEKDPFIPSHIKDQSVDDTEFPAFLRRHSLKKNPDTKG